MTRGGVRLLGRRGRLGSTHHCVRKLRRRYGCFTGRLRSNVTGSLLKLRVGVRASTNGKGRRRLTSLIDGLEGGIQGVSRRLVPPRFRRLDLSRVLSHCTTGLARGANVRIDCRPARGGTSHRLPGRATCRLCHVMRRLAVGVIGRTSTDRVIVDLHTSGRGGCALRVASGNGGTGGRRATAGGGSNVKLHAMGSHVETVGTATGMYSSARGGIFALLLGVGR